MNNWIQTFTGEKFHFLNPSPDEICITDIAHALSNICRFTGHCNKFYSVAQHSVIMSQLIDKDNALAALLHDASEAYIADLAAPIKNIPEFGFYREIETAISNCIKIKFDIKYNDMTESAIKHLDILLLVTEARQLGLMSPDWSLYEVEPLNFKIDPLPPEDAEILFLSRFILCDEKRDA